MRIELLPSREREACALERGAYALNVERLVGPYGLLDDSSGIERGVVAFSRWRFTYLCFLFLMPFRFYIEGSVLLV